MSVRSARRPLPALVFLLALAVLAVVVWIRVSQRESDARAGATPSCTAAATAQLPANAAVSVVVLNANGGTGLAKTTLDGLAALGFTAGGSDNYTGATPIPGVGTITSGPNGVAAAKLVAYYLPGATITPVDSRQDTSVTVTIGPGFTALATAAVAKAAIAKAGLTQSAAPAPATSASPPANPSGSASRSGSPSPTSTCP